MSSSSLPGSASVFYVADGGMGWEWSVSHGQRNGAPQPVLDRMGRFRKMAIALTAVEARYLPNLDPEFIQLSNVPDVSNWTEYRADFDPVRTQAWLSYPSGQVSQDGVPPPDARAPTRPGWR